ncbi:MAG: hypothetical protein WCH86_04385 [Kiritimatiellales bacterium]
MFSQDECLDRLQRGLEMEEKLANSLSRLCLESTPPADLPEPARKRIFQILEILQRDTLRHEQNIRNWLTQLDQGELTHE